MKPRSGISVPVVYKALCFRKLTEINDELDNLQHSDVLLPPDADTTGTLEVVPVHDNVDQQVDGDGNPLHSSQTNELSVAKQSGGTVVVGVEEGQGLLLEDEEDGVQELDVFVDVVQLCEWLVSRANSSIHLRMAMRHLRSTGLSEAESIHRGDRKWSRRHRGGQWWAGAAQRTEPGEWR